MASMICSHIDMWQGVARALDDIQSCAGPNLGDFDVTYQLHERINVASNNQRGNASTGQIQVVHEAVFCPCEVGRLVVGQAVRTQPFPSLLVPHQITGLVKQRRHYQHHNHI